MKRWTRPASTAGSALGIAAIVASAMLAPSHTTYARTVNASGHPCVTAIGSGDNPFTRNFNPYASPNDFSVGGVYEPLTFYVPSGKRYYWLATGMKISNHGKTITLPLRHGVTWSDGKPFTSADVVFTLEAGKTLNPALDKIGYVSKPSNVASVKALGKYAVSITLKKADSTFPNNFNNIWILPKHIWAAHKSDATKWLDPNPVGTGPFKLTRFNSQEYILSLRKGYWQPMHITCLERLYESGNDSAMLSTLSGQADWTHNFIQNVQKVYVAKNRKDFHYWYSTISGPIGLFMDDNKYPESVKAFREAISMAINRQQVYKVGEYGYEPPAGALGIEHQYPKWIDPKLVKEDKALSAYSPSKARATLRKAGFTYQGSQLMDPKGNAVKLEIHVIAGWTDWVASLGIIKQNLQAIGINVDLRLDPDYGTWWPIANSQSQSTLLWTYSGGQTPYEYFNEFFNPKNVTASGTDEEATGDWAHYSDASAVPLLNQWKSTYSLKTQKKLAYKLEAKMLKDFPVVPVMVGAVWYTYSSKYFTGWPNQSHPYANGEWGSGTVDWMPILTHLRPVK
ncbi:MAG TPA: ABC transporter substrate-binding protein [Chloroflexota bacterium]|nr:ABC transporter substrate-binding protein [Chloroflexota bacterium]